MAVDNSTNAALLAVRILALKSLVLERKLIAFQKKQIKIPFQNAIKKIYYAEFLRSAGVMVN